MKTLRNLSFLFVAGLFFAGCHSNDDEVGNWKKVESFGGMGRLGAVSFVLGDLRQKISHRNFMHYHLIKNTVSLHADLWYNKK